GWCGLCAPCGRALFSPPCAHGGCGVSAVPPVSVEVGAGGEPVFRAALAAGPAATGREPSRCGEDGWEGPIFFPTRSRGSAGHGRAFFARLRGHTLAYPFLPADDAVSIFPSRNGDVFRALADS